MFENLSHNILASIWIYKPWQTVNNRKAKLVFVLLCGGGVLLLQCDKFPSWWAREGWGCYHRGLCHFWIWGTALPRCPPAAGGAMALLLSPWYVWGEAGKILKTRVLLREVSQWGTQEEKCINCCFSPDLYLHVCLTKGPIYILRLWTFSWNKVCVAVLFPWL